MGSTLDLAKEWLRAFVVDGVPASGISNPQKSDGIATFVDADTRLTNLEQTQGSSKIVQDTWANLSPIAGTFAGEGAEVYADAGTHTDPVVGGTVANTGVYTWSTSPAGWKWISADALSAKAPLASPAFTGSPNSPTPSFGDSSTKLATMAALQAANQLKTAEE